MRPILSLLFVVGFLPGSGQSNPFAAIRYDSVVAYNFALNDHRVHAILEKDSTLNKTTVLPGRKLTQKEIKSLVKTLVSIDTYGGTSYACFDPKHAFIFYREKRIVALVEICFDCSNIRSTPHIPATSYHFNKSGQQYNNYGFSKSGEKWLMDFCRSIGLVVKDILPRPGD
jgi:hypothetical protein